MLLETERVEIVRYGKKLLLSGLTTATGGNLSIFNRSENLVAISPSGVDYYDTQPEAVVVLTLDGEIMEGAHKHHHDHAQLAKRSKYDTAYYGFIRPLELLELVWKVNANCEFK